jgi:hypothetical protein
MEYKKVNQVLAKEFGAGQVEVRKAKKGQPWGYTLWFLSDNPSPSIIEKAKKIVGQCEPTHWFDELVFQSE